MQPPGHYIFLCIVMVNILIPFDSLMRVPELNMEMKMKRKVTLLII